MCVHRNYELHLTHVSILGFTNDFKTYSALLFLDICVFTHSRKAALLAVKLVQSFLGTQVRLKFSHPKEKPVLCFLGRRMAWEYTPGSGSCFCRSMEAKDNQWGMAFPNPQQELQLLHRALPTGTAMETVAKASSSCSLSGWWHLFWVKIRPEESSRQTSRAGVSDAPTQIRQKCAV